MTKEVIPSSRTGKAADEDAVRVELHVGGKIMPPFKIEGVSVNFIDGYYALPEDLDIIMASFVQKKRKRDPKPEPKPPSSNGEHPAETPGDSPAAATVAASSDDL